jgi:hypothetical protein
MNMVSASQRLLETVDGVNLKHGPDTFVFHDLPDAHGDHGASFGPDLIQTGADDFYFL